MLTMKTILVLLPTKDNATLPTQYLTTDADIRTLINKLALAKILWLDTETADYNTYNSRVSLIQLLAEPRDSTGDRVYILDVLDKPELVTYFISQIMVNQKNEKVFHNASYDLKFLGKEQAKNVTCTYRLGQKITKAVLQVTDLKLKTLAAQLCKFFNIDKEKQGSDWGRRPLTQKQLEYAKMDPVYLAQVHQRLLEITKNNLETVSPASLSVTIQPREGPHWNGTQVKTVVVVENELRKLSLNVLINA